MSLHRRVRSSLLASAIAVTLLGSAGQAGASAAGTDDKPAPAPAPALGAPAPRAQPGANPFDEVEHRASAPRTTFGPAPAPGGHATGRVPGRGPAGCRSGPGASGVRNSGLPRRAARAG
ncbi:collagenase, partial [Streptomyces sp. NPDC049602]